MFYSKWGQKLDTFGQNVLQALGYDDIPEDHNPVTAWLEMSKQDTAIESAYIYTEISQLPGFGKAAISKVAALCQMAVYDKKNGPDGDGKRKGLRRQWYAWFKTRFAIPFSALLAENGDAQEARGFNGTNWAGRMSSVYGSFVDEMDVTYWDLWITDASRMMEKLWSTLVQDMHIVLAVEKDSLFGDFKEVAQAIGARCLVSGKGKQSKAATEKMLRDCFSIEYGDPFSEDSPLYVLHISDHDMDGEAVIGPTFGQQCRRYTPHVVEGRVGITPESFRDEFGNFDETAVRAAWYETKATNNGYLRWSERTALFEAECVGCGHKWIVEGAGEMYCPQCFIDTALTVKVGSEVLNQPYGFEVEALPTHQYYGLVVEALLRLVSFGELVSKLRDECVASEISAAQEIAKEVFETNRDYQRLLAEFDRLNAIKEAFEYEVETELRDLGKPHVHNWRDEDDDPEPQDFIDYAKSGRGYGEPWRPFNRRDRTNSLIAFLQDEETDAIYGQEDEYGEMAGGMVQREIKW